MRFHREITLCVVVAAASGCVFDASVDARARSIACKVQDDCPPDFLCREALERCVPVAAIDHVAPTFDGAPTVAPRFVRAGVPVVVTFKTTEPLGEPAAVTLVDAQTAHPMTSSSSNSATSFSFSYTPTGTEPEGDAAILVDLVDPGGDASFGLLAGVVTLDFSAPTIVDGSTTIAIAPPPTSLSATTTQLVANGSARVTFRVDDVGALASAQLHARAGSTNDLDMPSAPAASVDERAFTIADHGEIAAGTYDVVATVTDAAGNGSTSTVAALVVGAFVPSPCPAVDASGAPGCTDDDGDGHFGISDACPAGDDCNDDEPLTFPNAPEIPGDGLDNACQGGGDAAPDDALGVFAAPAAAGGSSTGDGTRAHPLDGLRAAADAAHAAQKRWIFLAAGAYTETSPVDATDLSIAGSFDPSTWTRTPSSPARTTLHFTASTCAPLARVALDGDRYVVDAIDAVDDCDAGGILNAVGGFGMIRDVALTSAADDIDVRDGATAFVARATLTSTAAEDAVFSQGKVTVLRSRITDAHNDALECSGPDAQCDLVQSIVHGSFNAHGGASARALSTAIVSTENTPSIEDSLAATFTQATVVLGNGTSLLSLDTSVTFSPILLQNAAVSTDDDGGFFITPGGAESITLRDVVYDSCLIQLNPATCVDAHSTSFCAFPGCEASFDATAVGPFPFDADGRPSAAALLAGHAASLAGTVDTVLAVDPDGRCRDLAHPDVGAFVLPAP